jgi:hypothetical protein
MVIMPHPESRYRQPIQGCPSHLPSPVIRQSAVAAGDDFLQSLKKGIP